jgi:hypothetical protein
MMNKLLLCIASIASVCTLAATPALAAEHATKDDAIGWVKKAVAHYKAVGKTQAFADFSVKEDNPWLKGELYIGVTDLKTGVAVALSRSQAMIGKDMSGLKDVDGKLMQREMMDKGLTGKPSWTDYRFPNPVTKEIESKSNYCEPYDGYNFCTGVYR